MATIVLTVINTAPAAGLSKMPCLYKTPAAPVKLNFDEAISIWLLLCHR